MSNDLLGEMREARNFFKAVIDKFTKDSKTSEDMMTIFDEATTNAIRHAYPENKRGIVRVSLYVEEKGNEKFFVLTVFDRGEIPKGFPMDMSAYEVNLNKWFKEGKKIGGIGLMVISRLADKAFWKKVSGGKYFVAIKKFE